MNVRPIATSIALAFSTMLAMPSASLAVEHAAGKGSDKVTAVDRKSVV